MTYQSVLKLALLILFSQSAYSSQQPENGPDLYNRALAFRDGKIDGYSKDDAGAQAESIFLELANQGNEKAAHNYAVIQYKKGNYELAGVFFQKSSLEASKKNLTTMREEGKIKEDLYLVAGSNRRAPESGGAIFDAIWGNDKVDMTHRKTFDGRAVTMHSKPSKIKDAKHIVGDVRTLDFSKYNIKAAFLERMPTVYAEDVSSPERNTEANLTRNYQGACIQNIAKAMKPGAPIHIEWHPYVSLLPQNMQPEPMIEKNPFHGFLHLNLVFQSIFIYGGDNKNIELFPENARPAVLEMVKKVDDHIKFYHTQYPAEPIDKVKARLYWEVRVLHKMHGMKSMVLLDYYPPTDSTDKLIELAPYATYGNFPRKQIRGRIVIKQDDGNDISGILYDQQAFQTMTLFNFLIDDIAAEMNAPYVKKYMESNGFGNVSVAREENPYNGRKNVWMIRAVKL